MSMATADDRDAMKMNNESEMDDLSATADEMMEGMDRQQCEQLALELEYLVCMIKLRICDSRESCNSLSCQQPSLFPEYWWN